MRNRHQEALKKSVMLGHASQASGLMQNVHDKCQNLSDPDIFAVDRTVSAAVFPLAVLSESRKLCDCCTRGINRKMDLLLAAGANKQEQCHLRDNIFEEVKSKR